ncbi:MgtC/SapB family protein [Candidatus Pacebacteria bacterium]|nr:MgtC/SapB family protein [Candidatus Paceibacterota bacterium]
MDIAWQLETAGIVLAAALLGAVIGFERRSKQKSAGIRTHALIAAAAALISTLSTYLIFHLEYPDVAIISSDPTRILHSIMIGVSFIGGGMIFRDTSSGEKSVKNLTTAASLLLTAIMGATVGLRLYVLAVAIVLLVLIFNIVLRILQNRIFNDHHTVD